MIIHSSLKKSSGKAKSKKKQKIKVLQIWVVKFHDNSN